MPKPRYAALGDPQPRALAPSPAILGDPGVALGDAPVVGTWDPLYGMPGNGPASAERMAQMKREDDQRAMANLVASLPIQPGYEGFRDGAANLFGGGGRRQQSYYKGVHDRISEETELDKARQERARRLAREHFPETARAAFRELGVSDAQAALAIDLMGMANYQPNLGTVTKGLGDLGDMELQRQSAEAMRNGDVRLANQLAAVRKDAMYEPVRELGGSYIPSGVALGDPDFQVQATPATQATVDLRHAQATKALRPPAPRASSARHPLGEGLSTAPGAGARPGETAGQAEVRKAREAIAAGVPRAAAVAHMRKKGFAHLADLLSKEGD